MDFIVGLPRRNLPTEPGLRPLAKDVTHASYLQETPCKLATSLKLATLVLKGLSKHSPTWIPAIIATFANKFGSRYASVKELFNLPETPPVKYAAIFGEEDEKLFQEVLDLARISPEIDFWLKMADDEEIMKGKRGKQMELIRPDGYDHVFAKISSDSDSDDLSSDKEDVKSESSVPAGSHIARFPVRFTSDICRIWNRT